MVPLIHHIAAESARALPNVAQKMEYRSKPRNEVSTIYEDKRSKPDGYFVPCGTKRKDDRLYWYEIGVPGEYKVTDQWKECIKVMKIAYPSATEG